MGLRDVRGLRVPINHPPAPLEVPQRPLRSDTNTSSPSDSPQTPQSPRVHLILQTSQSPSMPRKPLQGPQRAPQTPPITPQSPPQPQLPHKALGGTKSPSEIPPAPQVPRTFMLTRRGAMPGWRSRRWARARLPPRTARCSAVRLLLVSWGKDTGQGGPHRRSHPPTTSSTSPKGPQEIPVPGSAGLSSPWGPSKETQGSLGGTEVL